MESARRWPRGALLAFGVAAALARLRERLRVLEWYPTFARREYRLVRVVELVSPTESRWHDADAWTRLAERQPNFVAVYARRDKP